MPRTQKGLDLDDRAMMGLAMEDAKENWPAFPILPLKRYRSTPGGPDCALFLHPATFHDKLIVLEANLCDLHLRGAEGSKYLASAPRKLYGTIDEILADGWMVD